MAAAPAAFAPLGTAHGEAMTSSHGLSVFGDLKYAAGFRSFDYVNPDAPVGGVLHYIPAQWILNQNNSTFNNMNTFILSGDGPMLMENTFACLFARAYDEPDAMYGYAAESVRYDAKRKYFEFTLRPGLTFHDNSPLTAEDCAFSIETLQKNGHPMMSASLGFVESVKADSKNVLAVTLKEDAPRDVIFAVASAPILSRAYYSKKPFTEVTLEPPLGSGGFKVGRFEQGRFIEYDRVENWWGWKIPALRGQFNWKKIRIDFYRDREVGFEGFKAGQYLLRYEASSKFWVTGYNFPAMQSGQVKQVTLNDGRPSGMQGFFINMRREKFMDPRVRRAIAYAFDFEWSNKNLFYDQYTRTQSIFQNSVLMADGAPKPEELALLEPFRGNLPKEVFETAYMQPVSDASGRDRKLLRTATDLLVDAGIKIKREGAFLPNGERFTIEFMGADPAFDRIILPYINNLKLLGIAASIRNVDAAQYQSRRNNYDFDITTARFGFDLTPGDGLRRMLSSKDAKTPGTYNLSGISHPAVDALLEKIITAANREALNTACRALDRVLRCLHFWVPQWYKPNYNVAYWDVYDRPATVPLYNDGILETWWVDQARAKKLGKGL